jgi:hypothetical protein
MALIVSVRVEVAPVMSASKTMRDFSAFTTPSKATSDSCSRSSLSANCPTTFVSVRVPEVVFPVRARIFPTAPLVAPQTYDPTVAWFPEPVS